MFLGIHTLISLDYHPFLQNSYQNLCDLPGFVLLESTDKSRGRYDILSAYPYDRVVIRENDSNKQFILDSLNNILSPQSTKVDLPFQGGAIGYISYDLGAQLYGIKSQSQEALGDMPLLDLGLYDWAIIVDHYLKTVTLFAANRHDSTKEITNEILSIWKSSFLKNAAFKVKTEFIPLITEEKYIASFAAIYQALKEGRSYQVNYTQPFQARYEGNTWGMYQKIISNNPVPFSAFIRTKEADIMSFSPERFLLYDQGNLLAAPIKGTVGRSIDTQIDQQLKSQLQHCTKNRAENIMIVDLLRNDLGKIAKPGSVIVTHLCELQSFNAVHHLVSTIEAKCRDKLSLFETFLSCFPGGSITGAPKIESMNIISEQEPFGRGIYCGSIGYFSRHGRFDTNIAIRTITAKDDMLHLAAGGGIVIDSICEDEYRECYTKISAIINGLK